jgi:anion-transporting  ArsA/GET3 family ATPase
VAPPPLRQRRLLFVTGKGGVGKTTVAAGLARSLADEGRSVLLCSVDERRDLADAFSLAQLRFEPTRVDDRLSVMAMDTEASLREYLKIFLKLPLVGRIGPIAAAFDFVATAAPGVKEILTIGKLCYEVRERRYDVVVVDAPATGHITGYLAAPQALQQLVRVGLIRGQTDWMLQLLSDEATTGVLVVTTAEEMPVSETLQLLEAIREQTTTHAAAVVVNRVLTELFVPRDAALVEELDARRPSPFDDPELVGLFDAARLAAARRSVSTEHLAVLRAGVPAGLPIVIQPYCFDASSPPRVVAEVARSLTEELA